jgi:hypothetical protein
MIGRGATAPAVRCRRAGKTDLQVYGSRSDLVPTFRSSRYVSTPTFHELRKVMGTSKFMILVPLFYLKFLNRGRRLWCSNFK